MIPVFRPSCSEAEIAAVAEVLRSGWWGMGPMVEEFERRFSAFVGAPHAVALNSCTAALNLALRLLGVGPGDEVIVPTITFVSTAHVVRQCGARVVFADVDPVTLNIDPDDAAAKISERTAAIIAVHYGGRPAELDRLLGLGPCLIEDAAHACGASYYGGPLGWGKYVCYSFHAVKNLACGDGGMLTMRDPNDDRRVRALRWLGIDKSTWERASDRSYWWQYNVLEVGEKCHMNDIAAAIGLAQLERLPAMNTRRQEIVGRYFEAFADLPVELPAHDDDKHRSSWHIFHLKVDPAQRDDLSEHLRQRGIATGVHYYPIHLYAIYGERAHLPIAERVWRRLITLPLFADMADSEVERVIDGVRGYYVGR